MKVLSPERLQATIPFVPTLEGQYIIKNLVLISAGIVVGATVRGGTRAVRVARAMLIAIFVCGMAILLAGIRVNLEPNEPFHGWPAIIRMTLTFAFIWVIGRRAVRHSVKRDVLPRKHRLEALLKELDG
jgi:hypothetical protein